MAKSAFENTASENKSIGFDYQYYYFLYYLLRIRDGESIGLEVKDDIHIDLSNDGLVLLQMKHTLQESSSGNPINLTERDIDLWKTIHNWIAVISDKTQGRTTESSKLKFISETSFVLVSNKGVSQRNTFLVKLSEFKNNVLSSPDLRKYLQQLYDDTSDSDSNKPLREYINELISLNDSIFNKFLKRIQFQLEEDDLISRIKKQISDYFVPPEKVDDVYHKLNSTLRDKNYLTVKSGKKIIISYDDFRRDYRNCFPSYLNLPIRRHTLILPNDYSSQTFIKQLLDIGDIKNTDTEEMIEFTKLKLLMFNNLNQWLQSGELTEQQKKTFIDNCITQWRNLHKSKHRRNRSSIDGGKAIQEIEKEIKEASLECLDEIRKIVLSIEDQKLDIEISNGQFYLLSDEPVIGWHLDWENRYKK